MLYFSKLRIIFISLISLFFVLIASSNLFNDDENNQLILYCNTDSFGDMQQELEKREIEIISSDFERIPLNFKQINDEQKNDLEKFLEMCENDDDVQNVFHDIRNS